MVDYGGFARIVRGPTFFALASPLTTFLLLPKLKLLVGPGLSSCNSSRKSVVSIFSGNSL